MEAQLSGHPVLGAVLGASSRAKQSGMDYALLPVTGMTRHLLANCVKRQQHRPKRAQMRSVAWLGEVT
jgi:hypothetical protein